MQKRMNKQKLSNSEKHSDIITQQGKAPKEIQTDLLAGEPDDLSIDFTNIVQNPTGESK